MLSSYMLKKEIYNLTYIRSAKNVLPKSNHKEIDICKMCNTLHTPETSKNSVSWKTNNAY